MPATKSNTPIAPSRRIGPRELKLLADPVREYIVGALVPVSHTVTELAEQLRCPPTRLYHHVKKLEAAGLLRVESTRLVSGIVERHFRATARQFLLDRTVFGRGRPDAGLDAILTFVFEQSRHEITAAVADGRLDLSKPTGDPRAVAAYRASAWLTPREAGVIRRKVLALHNEVEAKARRKPVPGSTPMSLTAALFPTADPAQPAAAQRTTRERRTRR